LASAEIARAVGSAGYAFSITGFQFQTEISKNKAPFCCFRVDLPIEGNYFEKELRLKIRSLKIELNKNSIWCLRQFFESVGF